MSTQLIRSILFAIAMLTPLTAAASSDRRVDLGLISRHLASQPYVPSGIDFTTCNVTPGVVECDAPDLEPSILNGRTQEMTIGARFSSTEMDTCTTLDGETFLPADYKIKLELTGSYGGHDDLPHNPRPIGKIEFGGQTDGDFQPQGVSGSATDTDPELNVSLSAGTYSSFKITLPEAAEEALLTIWTNCDTAGLGLNMTTKYHFKVKMDVALARLEDMNSATNISKLIIERSTNSHRDSAGYGTTTLEDSLDDFNEQMEACLPLGIINSLTVTAASLIHGGLYDIERTWKSPHKNHRIGNDADIGLSAINQDQQKLSCVEQSRVVAGLTSPVPTEQIEQNSNGEYYVTGAHDHIHLVANGNHFYPLDESSLWW